MSALLLKIEFLEKVEKEEGFLGDPKKRPLLHEIICDLYYIEGYISARKCEMLKDSKTNEKIN